jgi:hypothetical protein
MTKIPDKLTPWVVFAAGGALGSAGLSGMIARGEFVWALSCFGAGLLLNLWGILLVIHRPRNEIQLSIITTGLILVTFIVWVYRISRISPIARTIAVYEMNAWGNKMWKGTDHAAINLLTHPSLEAEIQTENRQQYILQPAIQHEEEGLAARMRMFIHVPDACHFTPLPFMYSRGRWIPPRIIREGSTSYDTTLPDVASGDFRVASDFGFMRSDVEIKTCQITYQIFGADNKERHIPSRETVVTISFP